MSTRSRGNGARAGCTRARHEQRPRRGARVSAMDTGPPIVPEVESSGPEVVVGRRFGVGSGLTETRVFIKAARPAHECAAVVGRCRTQRTSSTGWWHERPEPVDAPPLPGVRGRVQVPRPRAGERRCGRRVADDAGQVGRGSSHRFDDRLRGRTRHRRNAAEVVEWRLERARRRRCRPLPPTSSGRRVALRRGLEDREEHVVLDGSSAGGSCPRSRAARLDRWCARPQSPSDDDDARVRAVACNLSSSTCRQAGRIHSATSGCVEVGWHPAEHGGEITVRVHARRSLQPRRYDRGGARGRRRQPPPRHQLATRRHSCRGRGPQRTRRHRPVGICEV